MLRHGRSDEFEELTKGC